MRRKVLFGLFVVLMLFGSAYLAVSYVLYDTLANIEHGCQDARPNRPDNFTDRSGFWREDFDYAAYFMPEYESVRFPSREAQFTIAGWYAEAVPDAPAVIVVHGLGSCKNAHTVLVPAGMLYKAGFNVLMVDMRDVNESDYEDGRFALGNEEYLDVLGGWDWLVNEKGIAPERIGMVGNSLGAATTLIAFAQEPQLAAVFVDSPFDNLPQIIDDELERANYPQFLTPGGILMARLVAGDNVVEHDPHEAIAKADGRPLFILHGTADGRISVQHSYELQYRAETVRANAAFWFPEGVDHVQTASALTDEYESRLVAFFRENLGEGGR
ncbi:MAG: prolyl oligopeptidase family serine peptidase [Chloroflexi bacterium]|nr:prolyl oligopeptidase family serine peptidase [Chloroflexota bacterium]